MTRELRFQARFYSCWSCSLIVIGIVILLAALHMSAQNRLIGTLMGTGGSLVGSVTVFPIATIFSTRRKLSLLVRYESELRKPLPTKEALDAVKEFLKDQLKN